MDSRIPLVFSCPLLCFSVFAVSTRGVLILRVERKLKERFVDKIGVKPEM